MNIPKCMLVGSLLMALSTPALAQESQQKNTAARPQGGYTTGTRPPVATQPSNNPFQNPIGQGVPPATSVNPNLNNSRTNAPR